MNFRILIVLAWLAATVGWTQDVPRAIDLEKGIPFEVNRNFGVILIKAQIDGHQATLILDTGCNRTVISPEVLRLPPSPIYQADAPAKGSRLVGTARWAKAEVHIGTNIWLDRTILVRDDFRVISNSLKQRIDGLLGDDILSEFNVVVVDFKRHRLLLSR